MCAAEEARSEHPSRYGHPSAAFHVPQVLDILPIRGTKKSSGSQRTRTSNSLKKQKQKQNPPRFLSSPLSLWHLNWETEKFFNS